MKKQKLLITGISGLLGSNLAYCLQDYYDIIGVYNRHHVLVDGARTYMLDLLDEQAVTGFIETHQPDIIFHAAAQASVEECERNPALARDINVNATALLTRLAQQHHIKMVYVSTDLVYDGLSEQCSETDEPNPQNLYAKTKLDGEIQALKNPETLVLRINIFGWNIQPKHSLAEWGYQNLKNRRPIKGFTDAIFSSIYTFDFAKIVRALLNGQCRGIYNVGSSSSISKYDFLCRIADKTGLDSSLIDPINIGDFSFKAKRSKNLRLDISKLQNDLSITVPTIEESVDHFINDISQDFSHRIGVLICDRNIYPKTNVTPYGRQWIDQSDINAVIETLKSENVTQGPRIQDFENRLCDFTGAKYAVAVTSGTAALHLGCLVLGLGQGDEGITSPNSFVASSNCMVYAGARPVFADINPKTFNIDPVDLSKRITPHTRMVIPVHFAGQSCDMVAIRDVVQKAQKKYGHSIHIIEDGSHALGSSYKGRLIGSCEYSDMTVFSFHPVKHITTGEGGAILTNDKEIYQKLLMLRSHGITNHIDLLERHDRALDQQSQERNMWYYEQHVLGFNYRMTDIQATLGLSQLEKLPMFIKKRQEIVSFYKKELASIDEIGMPDVDVSNSNLHLFVIRIDFENLKKTRHQVMTQLKSRGVLTQVHYIPIYSQPYYQKQYRYSPFDYSNMEHYYAQCLSIPLFPAMSIDDAINVVAQLKEVLHG